MYTITGQDPCTIEVLYSINVHYKCTGSMYTLSVQDPCTLTYKLNVGGKIVFIYLFCFQQVLKKCAREESKIERGIFIFLKTPKLERILLRTII